MNTYRNELPITERLSNIEERLHDIEQIIDESYVKSIEWDEAISINEAFNEKVTKTKQAFEDFDEVAIALKNVATLMDAISIQLQNTNGERDHKFDLIRCDLEDFKEDLEEQKIITKEDLWAWLDTCPTRKWDVVQVEDDYMRIIFPFNDPKENES